MAKDAGIWIGAGVEEEVLSGESAYRDTLAKEFSMVTPGWVMKPEPLSPQQGRFDFTQADRFVEFAETHRLRIRGHALVWETRNPKWVMQGGFTSEELEKILKEHIETVAGRYRGRIHAWDVVNEPFEYGTWSDSVWLRALGQDYVAHALRWAHAADPEARLFINENWADGVNEQSDALYVLARSLLDQGAPLHGVGFQMAVGFGDLEHSDSPVPPDELHHNFARFSEMGLEIHVTEMAVRIGSGEGSLKERLEAQARVYHDVLSVGLDTPGFNALVQWGVCDADPWASAYGAQDKPFLFDESYRPKSAYEALRQVLIERATGA